MQFSVPELQETQLEKQKDGIIIRPTNEFNYETQPWQEYQVTNLTSLAYDIYSIICLIISIGK